MYATKQKSSASACAFLMIVCADGYGPIEGAPDRIASYAQLCWVGTGIKPSVLLEYALALVL